MSDLGRTIWRSRWTPVLVVLTALACVWVYRHPPGRATFQLQGNMLVSGNPGLHEVCFTFDDGPHPDSMTKILDILKRENIKATFFVVGKVVDQNPNLVRRMMAEGHEVGNHTYSHKRLNQMPIKSARQEIAACAASVKRATGADMTLLRPPGMEYNNDVLYLSQDMGYVTCHWNVVAGDYVSIAPALVARRVLDQVKPGAVILLHDSPDTALALPAIIKELKARKYRFVTASQMLSRLPRPVVVATNAYAVKPETLAAKMTVSPGPSKRRQAPAPVFRRVSKPTTPVTSRPPVDAPVWDGSRTDGGLTGDQSQSS